MKDLKVLVVGNNSDETQVGYHFIDALKNLSIDYCSVDLIPLVGNSNKLLNAINWHVFDKKPTGLSKISNVIKKAAIDFSCRVVVTTGACPITIDALKDLSKQGIHVVNFSTDDPWNKGSKRNWHLKNLPFYSHIFSPRKANLPDFKSIGCDEVVYLPFGFNKNQHFAPKLTPSEVERYWSEVYFAGGADSDRLNYFTEVSKSGLNIVLQGGYWDQNEQLKKYWHGFAKSNEHRNRVFSTKYNVGLVRLKNRDSHCMRSYEIPAMGGFLLAIDSEDHRRMYGDEGDCVAYFSSPTELNQAIMKYYSDDHLRADMARRLHDKIAVFENSYSSRMKTILSTVLG